MSERKIVEYKGESHSLYEWAMILNRNYSSLRGRYDKGLRGEELFVDKITVKCKICGKEFITNKTIKQCCSAECVKINAKNNYNALKERQKEEKKQCKQKNEKKLTANEITIMAKKAGMSYGYYTALMGL